jgi:uncharacterized cupredoxin-like copper-binding protein
VRALPLATAVVVAAAVAVAIVVTRADDARTVELVVEHSHFAPDTLTVRAGQEVRFVMVNDDPIDHELIIGPMSVQREHERGHDTHHDGSDGAVSVPANSRGTTTYVFDEAGTIYFGCHLPGHWDYGMRGTITVEG